MNIALSPQIKARLAGVISRGVMAAEVNESGHLIFTMSDNSVVDLGEVIGPAGPQGEPGPTGPRGPMGPAGPGTGDMLASVYDPYGIIAGNPLGITGAIAEHTLNDDIHVTAELKAVWDAKQNAIPDLDEIRTGALTGESAYQLPAGGIPAEDLAENYILTSARAAENGVASLGADGKVPVSQLPVYDGSVVVS